MDDKVFRKIKTNFLSELKKAEKGSKSSLSYIKNPLPRKPLVTSGTVQALVVGGTNYISALVRLQKAKIQILKTQTGKLPVFKSKESFSGFLEKILKPQIQALSINFAFPLQPEKGKNGELDGIVIRGTKEHTFRGLIGKKAGDFAKEIYFQKYDKQIPVTVANDTVCLTLSGGGSEDAAMVLGTGFNIGLKIKRGKQIFVVNLEAGNFNKILKHEIPKSIEKHSENPGQMLFEKSVSGRYLADYFSEQARLAGSKRKLKTTKDLSVLAKKGKTIDSELARSTLKQSADMVACALAAVYEYANLPKKFTFITEGSLFWKGWHYKQNVENQLLKLGVPKGAIRFKEVEDSSLKGAINLLTK